MRCQARRQRVRIGILLASFALFPVTIFYFSPYLVVWGAFQGVVAGSAIAFGLQLASAIFLRRAFCGWACPAGGLQELEAQAASKPCKLGKRVLVKWVIWAPWVASIVAGFIVAGGVSRVDPLFHIDGGISVSSPGAMMIYLIIVALFFVPNLFLGRRAMCHCICWMAPFMIIGEKLGATIHAPQLHVAAEPAKCISCGLCEKACPMSLPVSEFVESGAITHSECIQCAACCDACRKGALKLEFGQLSKAGGRMILETQRLALRPWVESDAESLYEYAKDPQVGPIAGWPPHTSVENSRQIIRDVLSADETYAVCLKEDNRAIGSIGLISPMQSHTQIGADELEVGYWIGVPFWGRGLIPEAAEQLIRHAFEDLGCGALWCGYYEGNEKSRRCSEKLGFTLHHVEHGVPCELMGDVRTEYFTRLTKEDWTKATAR